MAKPVRPLVNRDDYEWFIKEFGDDGVSPSKGELFSRVRTSINSMRKEIFNLKEVL